MKHASQRTTEKGIRKVWLNGRWVYRLQLMLHGERASQVCDTLEEALVLKRQWLAGGLPVGRHADVPPLHPTVRASLAAYRTKCRAAGRDVKTIDQLERVLEREMPELLPMRLDRLDGEREFRAYRQRRERPRPRRRGGVAPIKPNTILLEMRMLRAAIRLLHPAFTLSEGLFPRHETRVRFFEPLEALLVEASLDSHPNTGLGRLGRLMLLNITRQIDWRRLRREHVHRTERRLELPESKGTVRPLDQLSDESWALLEAQLASHGHAYVFAKRNGEPYAADTVYRVLKGAIRAAGRGHDCTPHDFRHHVASAFVEDGASDRDLKALGGWKTTEMLARYAHVKSQRLRELNERLSRGRLARRDADSPEPAGPEGPA